MPLPLRPSEIFYSQKGISYTFGKYTSHSGTRIGDTLEGLIRGDIQISDIPNIRVVNKDGKWFTLDNRRLWVFRSLEEAGKCNTIPVNEEAYNQIRHGDKFTTINDGVSISMNERRHYDEDADNERSSDDDSGDDNSGDDSDFGGW